MVIYTNFKGMEETEGLLRASKESVSQKMEELNTTVTETTLNDWKGPDARAFVESTTEKVNAVRTEYEEYFDALRNEINANVSKFKNVQQRNINMID